MWLAACSNLQCCANSKLENMRGRYEYENLSLDQDMRDCIEPCFPNTRVMEIEMCDSGQMMVVIITMQGGCQRVRISGSGRMLSDSATPDLVNCVPESSEHGCLDNEMTD